MTAPERIWADAKFWPNVQKTDTCWLWTSSTMGSGYGSIRPSLGADMTGAHRFSWALHNGRWPRTGEVVMHTCDVPLCVNPEHLTIGSQSDNIKQCVDRGRHKPFSPEKQTHCRNGHEYTPENTQQVISRGLVVRRCRVCKNETQKRWMDRQNGK